MQTFLPHINYLKVARVLDNKRLNKQILEGYQILNTLSGRSTGWIHHPAVKMWRGAENELWMYVRSMITET